MDSKLSEAGVSRERIADLHARISDLLHSLDDAELYGAAAYVSMALDAIQRDFPDLNATR